MNRQTISVVFPSALTWQQCPSLPVRPGQVVEIRPGYIGAGGYIAAKVSTSLPGNDPLIGSYVFGPASGSVVIAGLSSTDSLWFYPSNGNSSLIVTVADDVTPAAPVPAAAAPGGGSGSGGGGGAQM